MGMAFRPVWATSALVSLALLACNSVGGGGAAPGGAGPGLGQAGPSAGSGGTTQPPATMGMPPAAGVLAPTSRAMRLSNAQWENTVQDLFRLPAPLGLSASFVADPLIGAFDTYGGVLVVDANRFQDYQTAAETVAQKVAHDPTILATLAPPVADTPTRKANFLRDFGLRAFRRPLSDADIARYSALFDKGASLLASGDDFVDGVELSVRAFMQSPNFLYRLETSSAVVNGAVPLNDYEVASRLSYGLTGTMPDDALFAAAAAKQLEKPADIATQAQRLVASTSGQATVGAFHSQLLHLSDDDQISKDPQQAPEFTAAVPPLLKQETLSFVNDVIYEQDLGIAELLSAPYTFANSTVAKLFGDPTAPGLITEIIA